MEILQRYRNLQDIIAILGMDELSEEDKNRRRTRATDRALLLAAVFRSPRRSPTFRVSTCRSLTPFGASRSSSKGSTITCRSTRSCTSARSKRRSRRRTRWRRRARRGASVHGDDARRKGVPRGPSARWSSRPPTASSVSCLATLRWSARWVSVSFESKARTAGRTSFFVDGGFVQVVGDQVSILAAAAEPSDSLDGSVEAERLDGLRGSGPARGAELEEFDAHRRKIAVAKMRTRLARRGA